MSRFFHTSMSWLPALGRYAAPPNSAGDHAPVTGNSPERVRSVPMLCGEHADQTLRGAAGDEIRAVCEW